MALDEMLVNDKEVRKSSYLDLFRTKKIALKTISSIMIWISAGACYFGINQYITFIGSNVYLIVILLGSIQVSTSNSHPNCQTIRSLKLITIKFCFYFSRFQHVR